MNNAPIGCTISEPAQIATKPANGPLCRKPGSFLPIKFAANVPPTIAISELIATKPEMASTRCALITLKPNQPIIRIHEPKARNGMDDGGWALTRPSFL